MGIDQTPFRPPEGVGGSACPGTPLFILVNFVLKSEPTGSERSNMP
jgi:hypothetical protein